MSDKSLFRRNLFIIVVLHILVIGGLYMSGFFSRHQTTAGLEEGASSAPPPQANDTGSESTPAETAAESTPEKTPDNPENAPPSMIVLGTPPPRETPTPTPRRTPPTPTPATPTPRPTETPRPEPTTPKRTPHPSASPSPKKKPSRPPSPKPSAKKSASPKASPKHSASESEGEADHTPSKHEGKNTGEEGAAVTSGTSGTSTSKGKTGTHPGDSTGEHAGRGKEGNGSAAAKAAEVNWYLNMIHDRIYGRWTCPDVDPSLTALVKIRIQKDGHVSDVSLEKSSGNDAMDQSALTAAKSVTQFDPLPSAIEDSFYDVPIEFKPTSN